MGGNPRLHLIRTIQTADGPFCQQNTSLSSRCAPGLPCRSRTERQQQAEVIRAALALARSAAELMLPVARRRLDKEQRHGGLVVALALYGEEAAVAQMAKEAPQRWAAAQAAPAAAPEQDAERQASQQQQQGEQQQGDAQSASEAAQHAAAQQREQQQQHQQAPGGDGGGGGGDVPPAVADVTVAVQYMVESSKVNFHKGESIWFIQLALSRPQGVGISACVRAAALGGALPGRGMRCQPEYRIGRHSSSA